MLITTTDLDTISTECNQVICSKKIVSPEKLDLAKTAESLEKAMFSRCKGSEAR